MKEPIIVKVVNTNTPLKSPINQVGTPIVDTFTYLQKVKINFEIPISEKIRSVHYVYKCRYADAT